MPRWGWFGKKSSESFRGPERSGDSGSLYMSETYGMEREEAEDLQLALAASESEYMAASMGAEGGSFTSMTALAERLSSRYYYNQRWVRGQWVRIVTKRERNGSRKDGGIGAEVLPAWQSFHGWQLGHAEGHRAVMVCLAR